MSTFKKSLLLIFLLLVIDQAIKIYIKLNFNLGESIPIFGFDWARIHFTENKGAAFGILFGGNTGKLILSLFRIIAIIGLTYFLYRIKKLKLSKIATFSIVLILTGAIGNMIDSAFYGIIFSSSVHSIAQIFPETGGYAPLLFGSVVDMFHFPMYEIIAPNWFPEWERFPWNPGDQISFFPYIFNFADACITIGVIIVLFFRNHFSKVL